MQIAIKKTISQLLTKSIMANILPKIIPFSFGSATELCKCKDNFFVLDYWRLLSSIVCPIKLCLFLIFILCNGKSAIQIVMDRYGHKMPQSQHHIKSQPEPNALNLTECVNNNYKYLITYLWSNILPKELDNNSHGQCLIVTATHTHTLTHSLTTTFADELWIIVRF